MERAQLLKEARLKRRLTREQVAQRCGVDPSTVKRWENGTSTPQPINLYSICEVYGVTPQALGFQELLLSEQTFAVAQNATISDEEEEDALTSFREQDLTSRLMHIVWNWLISCNHARYQELQMLILLELEGYSRMHPDNINRRNALRRMALLAVDICALSVYHPVLKRPTEEILAHCASGIVACWYLRKGKELTFADDAVSNYIPTLKEIVKSAPETQRKAAADLLAQCFLLKAVLAWHVTGTSNALSYAQRAEKYSELAGNRSLQIIALRTRTATYCFSHDWEQAFYTVEKAKELLERKPKATPSQPTEAPIPQLVHSYVYAGLATHQAYHRQKQEALKSLGEAHATFFAQSSKEPAPIWVDHNIGNLLLNDGQTYAHLGLYQQAIDSFGQIHGHYAHDTKIPMSCYVESLIDQVITEINREDQSPDMAWCIQRWTKGIEKAKEMQSEQRFNEAIQAYAAMRAVWRGEQRIKNLRDYVKHW